MNAMFIPFKTFSRLLSGKIIPSIRPVVTLPPCHHCFGLTGPKGLVIREVSFEISCVVCTTCGAVLLETRTEHPVFLKAYSDGFSVSVARKFCL